MLDVRYQLASEVTTDIEEVQYAIKNLFKRTRQEVLDVEMNEHLGYEKNYIIGINTGYRRNGYSTKIIKTSLGETELNVPKDHKGRLIKKYEKNACELEEQIIALYAKGMSTRDIEAYIRDIYGLDVSPELVSKVTDKFLPIVKEWQSRPLDPVYPIVFLDALNFKVRKENRIVNKAAYSVLGIDLRGYKEILGIWIGESESASFWLNVCNDLKNRGVEDILIASKDGLSGFSEAIKSVFPRTSIQLCVIHQIHHSMKYVSYKDRKAVMDELNKVYQALTLEEAELAFKNFKKDWGKKYPIVVESWEANWQEITTYFRYPYGIRRLINITNTVEAYNRQLKKVTKTKTSFPTDDSLRKIIYLANQNITKKWTLPLQNWSEYISQFAIQFEERLGTFTGQNARKSS